MGHQRRPLRQLEPGDPLFQEQRVGSDPSRDLPGAPFRAPAAGPDRHRSDGTEKGNITFRSIYYRTSIRPLMKFALTSVPHNAGPDTANPCRRRFIRYRRTRTRVSAPSRRRNRGTRFSWGGSSAALPRVSASDAGSSERPRSRAAACRRQYRLRPAGRDAAGRSPHRSPDRFCPAPGSAIGCCGAPGTASTMRYRPSPSACCPWPRSRTWSRRRTNPNRPAGPGLSVSPPVRPSSRCFRPGREGARPPLRPPAGRPLAGGH